MLLMGKSTISTGPFSMATLNYQRIFDDMWFTNSRNVCLWNSIRSHGHSTFLFHDISLSFHYHFTIISHSHSRLFLMTFHYHFIFISHSLSHSHFFDDI